MKISPLFGGKSSDRITLDMAMSEIVDVKSSKSASKLQKPIWVLWAPSKKGACSMKKLYMRKHQFGASAKAVSMKQKLFPYFYEKNTNFFQKLY